MYENIIQQAKDQMLEYLLSLGWITENQASLCRCAGRRIDLRDPVSGKKANIFLSSDNHNYLFKIWDYPKAYDTIALYMRNNSCDFRRALKDLVGAEIPTSVNKTKTFKDWIDSTFLEGPNIQEINKILDVRHVYVSDDFSLSDRVRVLNTCRIPNYPPTCLAFGIGKMDDARTFEAYKLRFFESKNSTIAFNLPHDQRHYVVGQKSRPFMVDLLEKYSKIIVTEGEFNVLSCLSCGIPAIATGGVGNTEYVVSAIKQTKCREIIILFDADDAGITGSISFANRLSEEIKQIKIKCKSVSQISSKYNDINDFLIADPAGCKIWLKKIYEEA